MQNRFLLKLVSALFDNSQSQVRESSETFHGVRASENGLFLYKSNQGDYLLKSRFVDYVLLFSLGGFLSGFNSALILPFLYGFLHLPRRYAVMAHFTYYAELLPHTEQVVFHKTSFLGKTRRVFVDIGNLEKIEADAVKGKIYF